MCAKTCVYTYIEVRSEWTLKEHRRGHGNPNEEGRVVLVGQVVAFPDVTYIQWVTASQKAPDGLYVS